MSSLTLGDKTYELAFKPWRVVKRLHAEQGINLLELVEFKDDAFVSFMAEPAHLSAMLWGGMIHAQPALTVAEVDDLFGPADMVAVGMAVTEAMAEAFRKDAVAANPPTPSPA